MGSIHSEFFYLRSTESVINFLNITEIVSPKQDEEVWVEIQSYRDRKHRDETMANMEKDKNWESLYEQYLSLITPGSRTIIGEFSLLNV
jgi:uncharacterized protein YbaA (DUF1428 family)